MSPDCSVVGPTDPACHPDLNQAKTLGQIAGGREAGDGEEEETNPAEVIAAKQVVTEIGLNIVGMAEKVVFRIGQWDGGRSVTELT